MKTAIHIGLSISEWEEITPYELSIHIEVFNEKTQLEQEEKLTIVWLGEYYHRVKKLPPLKDVLGKIKQKEPMTDKQMLEMVKKLNQALGGVVEEA